MHRNVAVGLMGVDEFTADPIEEPWEMIIPEYRPAEQGEYSLFQGDDYPFLRGYYNGLKGPVRNWVLTEKGKVWMSVTPMELESQAIHVAAATGQVLVYGLGMGVAAYNMALKEDVERVTVIERSNEVIDMILHNSDVGEMDKITIAPGDAFDYESVKEYDFAYADIWRRLGSGRSVGNMKELSRNVRAKLWGFWGQELEFVHWLAENDQMPPPTAEQAEQWVEWLEFPVVGQDRPEEYAQFAYRVARNVQLM